MGEIKNIQLENITTGEKVTIYDDTEVRELMKDLENRFIAILKNYQLEPKPDNEVVSMMRQGGDVVMVKDVKAEGDVKDITITKDANIDLNQHSLNAEGGQYGDTFVMGNGANITISNGTISPSDNATLENTSATIHFKTSKVSHLTLNNVTVNGIYPIYVNNSAEGSTITINSGNYCSEYADNPAIFCNKYGTKVIINGGTFGQTGVQSPYLLNILDKLRYPTTDKQPIDFIEVRGGEFWNFDPSNNRSEGEGTNYVGEGFEVVVENVGDDKLYKVIPKI